MLGWFPENISTYGQKIDDIFAMVYYIVGFWFLLVNGVLIYFIFTGRRSCREKASYITGKGTKVLAWVFVPVIIIFCFDIYIDLTQHKVWEEIKIHLPENPDQTIRITGKQFAWDFKYPGPDNKLDTSDDLETSSELYIPVNKKIVFELQAKDVLHSFWVPNIRLKQDAVPGRSIKGWFEVTKTGTFEIACAELCGVGHGNMKGKLHVLSDSDYQKWMTEQASKASEW